MNTRLAPPAQSSESQVILPGITPEPSGSFSNDYLRILTRRKWTILLPALICTTVAFVVSKYVPKQYSASTMIEAIDRQQVDRILNSVQLTINHKPYLTTVPEQIKTRQFLQELIQKCEISEGFNTKDPKERAQLLYRVKSNIDVKVTEQKTGNDLIQVIYTGRDAQKVMKFVNAITDKLMKNVMDMYIDEIRGPRELIQTQRDDAEKAYKEAAQEYQNWQKEEDFPDIGDKALVLRRTEWAQRTLELENQQQTLLAKQDRLEKVNQLLIQVPEQTVKEGTKKRNQAWDRQKSVVEEVERALATERARKWIGESPTAKLLQAKLKSESDKLNETQEFIEESLVTASNQKYTDLDLKRTELETDIRTITHGIPRLQAYIARLKVQVDRLPNLLLHAEELKEQKLAAGRALDTLERTYTQFDSAWSRVMSKQGQFFRSIYTPSPSEVEGWDPVFPNIPLFLGIGAVAGLLFGAGLAFVKEFGTKSFVSVTQVRHALPVAFLGEVGSLTSETELKAAASRKRRLLIICGLILLLLAALNGLFFVKSLQKFLPPFLLEALTRIWGAR